jgi:hypothetical protein
MVPGLPRRKALPGPDEPLTALSAQRSFLSAFSAGREGHAPASDALCRASPREALGFDPERLGDKNRQDPRPTAAPSKATFFFGPERLPSPACPAPLALAMLCRAPPPTSATCTIHEHSPRSPLTLVGFALSPRDDMVFRGSRPIRPSTITPGGVGLLAEPRQPSFNLCRSPL